MVMTDVDTHMILNVRLIFRCCCWCVFLKDFGPSSPRVSLPRYLHGFEAVVVCDEAMTQVLVHHLVAPCIRMTSIPN